MSATFLSELVRVAGAASVRGGTERAAGAAARVAGVRPLAWVEPREAEQVAGVLALCSAEGVPVEPAGGGTWLQAGRRPARPPVVVSTAGLSAVVEHEPADLVVGVQAGMSLAGLQQRLAGDGQVLPLDPPRQADATVGAVLALGSAGPLRAGHGIPRDFILGVEVATGDGRLVRFGGRVVKNVAGYDTVRLMVGSRGALGIITSVFLLLRSLPEEDRTLLLAAAGPDQAAALAQRVAAAVQCDALEILSPSLAEAVEGAAEDGPGSWQVLVRLQGGSAAVADAADRITRATPEVRARAVHGAAGQAVWAGLQAAEADAALYVRAAGPPSELAGTVTATLECAQAMSRSDNEFRGADGWRLAAHATAGIVRLWRPADPRATATNASSAAPFADASPGGADAAETAAKALGELRSDHEARGGSVICPVLPDSLRQRLDPYQAPPAAALRLMHGVRNVFDPAGIMSPGRHVL